MTDPDKKPSPPSQPQVPWYKPDNEAADELKGVGCLAVVGIIGYFAFTYASGWWHLHHGTDAADIKAREAHYSTCLDDCRAKHPFTEVDRTRCQDECVTTWKR